jgi:hypothetical protein
MADSFRELDVQIAEKVMGWRKRVSADHTTSDIKALRDFGIIYAWKDDSNKERGLDVPRYSTDIAAAWLVVEALAKAPHWVGVIVGTFGIPHAKCYRDSKLVAEEWIDLIDVPDPRSLSERCALAICRAALKAVGE